MGVIFFFIKEKIWNVNIFIEMSKLFFIDKRVERSSARHLPLCRLPADPWHPARACTPKQGCKTHPVWTAVWLFERDLNIPSVCPALVIEFFKQLTTLLLNLRPLVHAFDARDKLFHFALSAITYLTIINCLCHLNVDHKFLFNMIDILGKYDMFLLNMFIKLNLKLNLSQDSLMQQAKSNRDRKKSNFFLISNDNIYNSKLLLILTPKLKAT